MEHRRHQVLESLPDYVVADVDNLQAIKNSSLRKKALEIKFPLSDSDRRDISKLVLKFQNEKNIAGLAAPQIGISKRVIVLIGMKGEKQNKLLQTWINPSYEKVDDKMVTDLEECFSVKGVIGPVSRFKSVHFKAFTTSGELVEGVAKGFNARLIQHEIDHLNGILFIDLVPKSSLIPK